VPVYEYYCKHCDGIFETIRTISRAAEPAPCPVCARKAGRIPPTSFAARTMRDGYPRAIPDRGTYWHLGKEVKKPLTGTVRMNEHPELTKPRPKPRPSKGELDIMRDKRHIEQKEATRRKKDRVPEIRTRTPRKLD
jgi:putative FmdB family regulatory protein